ncbi:hypothetical protein FHS66_000382 [Pacificitalea manganoxidans]|nr:hypothetical protein [Pacificitalea manganoxidans]
MFGHDNWSQNCLFLDHFLPLTFLSRFWMSNNIKH